MVFAFLVAGIWSEGNSKYGYVVVPFTIALLYAIGWINFTNIGSTVAIVLVLGILAFLRAHLKTQFGVFGSNSGIIWKIISFTFFLQVAIIMLNGMAFFDVGIASDGQLNQDFAEYDIDSFQSDYSGSTSGLTTTDSAWMGFGMVWNSFINLWTLIFGFADLYKTLVSVFGIPAVVASALSAGFYLLLAIELFVLLFKPHRAPEV